MEISKTSTFFRVANQKSSSINVETVEFGDLNTKATLIGWIENDFLSKKETWLKINVTYVKLLLKTFFRYTCYFSFSLAFSFTFHMLPISVVSGVVTQIHHMFWVKWENSRKKFILFWIHLIHHTLPCPFNRKAREREQEISAKEVKKKHNRYTLQKQSPGAILSKRCS